MTNIQWTDEVEKWALETADKIKKDVGESIGKISDGSVEVSGQAAVAMSFAITMEAAVAEIQQLRAFVESVKVYGERIQRSPGRSCAGGSASPILTDQFVWGVGQRLIHMANYELQYRGNNK